MPNIHPTHMEEEELQQIKTPKMVSRQQKNKPILSSQIPKGIYLFLLSAFVS